MSNVFNINIKIRKLEFVRSNKDKKLRKNIRNEKRNKKKNIKMNKK